MLFVFIIAIVIFMKIVFFKNQIRIIWKYTYVFLSVLKPFHLHFDGVLHFLIYKYITDILIKN